ncbi:MAG TPA: hypothetical protein VGN70_08360 [Gammaproteobacteria bacterium]
MKWTWTWSGKSFGYWDGEDLWTHLGKHVGRRVGDHIHAPNGRYIGEVMGNERLATNKAKAGEIGPIYLRCATRTSQPCLSDDAAHPRYPGFDDFPHPDEL